MNIETYETIILPVFLTGHETWSLTVREEQTEGVREEGAEDNIWTEEG
jgi:hypothetical protein